MKGDISAVTILAMGHGDRETNLQAVQKSFLDKIITPTFWPNSRTASVPSNRYVRLCVSTDQETNVTIHLAPPKFSLAQTDHQS